MFYYYVCVLLMCAFFCIDISDKKLQDRELYW